MTTHQSDPKVFTEYRDGIDKVQFNMDKSPNANYGKPLRSFYSKVEGTVWDSENEYSVPYGIRVESEVTVNGYFNESAIKERDLKNFNRQIEKYIKNIMNLHNLI